MATDKLLRAQQVADNLSLILLAVVNWILACGVGLSSVLLLTFIMLSCLWLYKGWMSKFGDVPKTNGFVFGWWALAVVPYAIVLPIVTLAYDFRGGPWQTMTLATGIVYTVFIVGTVVGSFIACIAAMAPVIAGRIADRFTGTTTRGMPRRTHANPNNEAEQVELMRDQQQV